jgi:hypothetical protein
MPRPRFRPRLWMLMVAVAVVAVLIWGVQMWRLSRDYRQQATLWAVREQESRDYARSLEMDVVGILARPSNIPPLIINGSGRFERPEDLAGDPREIAAAEAEYVRRLATRASERADFHARLKQKYLHAARYPWLPVASDAPEPK